MASDGPSPHSPSLRLGLPAPQPSRHRHAQSLLGPSFHDPRVHHVLESRPEQAAPLSRHDDERCHWLSLHPCSAPLSCSLQHLLKLSLLSLRPSQLFHPIPLPCTLTFPPPSHRDATTPIPCWAPHFIQLGENLKVIQLGANGTNQTKECIRGRKPTSKRLPGR